MVGDVRYVLQELVLPSGGPERVRYFSIMAKYGYVRCSVRLSVTWPLISMVNVHNGISKVSRIS